MRFAGAWKSSSASWTPCEPNKRIPNGESGAVQLACTEIERSLMNPSTQVEIYDQLYRLSGPDEAHLQRLGARVDSAMRMIARQTRVVDSLRLAVLAAINLADENEMLRDKIRRLEATVAERSGRYHDLLDGAIAS